MNSIENLQRLASLYKDSLPQDNHKQMGKKYREAKATDQASMEAWFIDWMNEYCSEPMERDVLANGNIIYKLTDGCIFDRNHKDASVIIRTDGTICYNCFHDSCSNRHWSDFRFSFEPYKEQRNTSWKERRC